MRSFHVLQRGNRVEVHGWEEPIFYEVLGIDLPPLTNFAFAAWHLLPLALAQRFDFAIDGPVDAGTLANLRHLSRTWELWQPQHFRAIDIHAAGDPPPLPPREGELAMYSAGVDSTYMVLRRGRLERPGYVLTVHGMDYAHDAPGPFEALLERSRPLLERHGYGRIVIRSNAIRIARGPHAWGMALAGHAFLLSALFPRAVFAADCTWEQDMAIFPWGLNHVTDRRLSGRDFELRPTGDEVARSEKVAAIAADADALRAVSFCKDRSFRPANCGTCAKCVRTKVMFLATTGRLPPIFQNSAFSADMLETVAVDRIETAFLVDSFQQARDRGHLGCVPGLKQWMATLRNW